MISPFLVRNNFLYNNGPKVTKIFEELEIDPNSVIHGWKGTDWMSFYCYKGKMTFKPILVHDFEMEEYEKIKNGLDKDLNNILLMPRFKFGNAYTEFRNWGQSRWEKLYKLLIDNLPDYNIIICGKKGQIYILESILSRSLLLVMDDPLVPMLCALKDPKTQLAISSQSFLGKLALLQNVDTIMWGHEKQRHAVEENWSSDPKVKCNFIEDLTFSVEPQIVFEEILKCLENSISTK